MDHAFIQQLEPQLIADQRDLHQHPELGFEEHRTSADRRRTVAGSRL